MQHLSRAEADKFEYRLEQEYRREGFVEHFERKRVAVLFSEIVHGHNDRVSDDARENGQLEIVRVHHSKATDHKPVL